MIIPPIPIPLFLLGNPDYGKWESFAGGIWSSGILASRIWNPEL